MATFIHPLAVVDDPNCLGEGCRVFHWTHVRSGCQIGDNCSFGQCCYIDTGVEMKKNCKVQNSVNIYNGVKIGECVFIGQGVQFCNDDFPRATNNGGQPLKAGEWELAETIVEDFVSIGAGAVILPGIKLGRGAFIGAGAVVTKDVPAEEVWVGNPARFLKRRTDL